MASILFNTEIPCSCNSSVSTVSRLWSGRPWLRIWVGTGDYFPLQNSRTALRPTQPPSQWLPVILALNVLWPRHETDHSPPPSDTVMMNKGILTVPYLPSCCEQGQLYLYKNIIKHVFHNALLKPDSDRDMVARIRLVQHWLCFKYRSQDATIVTPYIHCMRCVRQISSVSTGPSLACGTSSEWPLHKTYFGNKYLLYIEISHTVTGKN